MWVFLVEHYPLVIFVSLTFFKGVVECWAKQHRNGGGQESSELISKLFFVMSLLVPVMIGGEIVFFRRALPIGVCLAFIFAEVVLMGLRVLCINTLGRFYSVNIRITDDQHLVRSGIYRYFRHPIYLIGIVDNVIYPMACGAYLSAVITTAIATPMVLWRRQQEDAALGRRFGREYADYRRQTWF